MHGNGYPAKEFSVHLNIETMVKGYHTYENVWVIVGKQLPCQRERANSKDPVTVSVTKAELIVGHVLGNSLLNALLSIGG